MLTLRRYLLGMAGGVSLASLSIAPAFAGLSVTWDPAGSAPAMAGTQFTFTNATIQDFDAINIVPNGATTTGGGLCSAGAGSTCGYTTAIIPLVSFTNVATTVNPVGYGTTYDLYGLVTATAIQSGTVAQNSGTFTSANFTLYGDPGNHLSVTFDPNTGLPVITDGGSATPVPAPTLTDIALATGSLACQTANANCQNNVNSVNGVPGAAVTTTFSAEPGQTGFFLSPPQSMAINLFGSFINNANELTCYDNVLGAACASEVGFGAIFGGAVPLTDPFNSPGTVLIQLGNSATINQGGPEGPGGGSVSFSPAPVPEPASLLLLGTGLLGLGAVARRRRNGKV